jgi:hypothetical protein
MITLLGLVVKKTVHALVALTGLSRLQNRIELELRVSWHDCARVCTD